MSLAEHDVVVLTRDRPEHNLRAGDVGAIVYVYAEGTAYEVEFATGSGQPLAVETLEPKDLRLIGPGEILHIRNVNAA
jgi:hypothetical protein